MFRSLLGIGRTKNLEHMLAQGALVLDVRTPEEFREAHVPGALNIPLEVLPSEFGKLNKQQPIVTCCRGDARSATAASLLTGNGFMARDGGSWRTVEKHLPRP